MTAEPASTTAGLFQGFSAAQLTSELGRGAIAFSHGFADDPRLSLGALAPLVASLPARWVIANEAQYSPNEPRGLATLDPDVDIARAVRGLAASPASIRVYNIEHTTPFRDLLRDVDAAVRALVGDGEGGVAAVNLGTFLASPGTVTPAHPDRHHNFLLQVSGRKEVWIEDDPDGRAHHRRVVGYLAQPEAGVAVLPPARVFQLGPGDGVYIPPYAFHWTTVVEGPAVAFSIGFSTPSTIRSAAVHDLDVRLRRRGWDPRPCRPDSAGERWKALLAGASVRAARARGRLARRRDRGSVPADQEDRP